MAPELFEGAAADEKSDQFSLGVTIYWLFSGRYPYGEIEPFSRPTFRQPTPLSVHRPDLPAWLDKTIDTPSQPIQTIDTTTSWNWFLNWSTALIGHHRSPWIAGRSISAIRCASGKSFPS